MIKNWLFVLRVSTFLVLFFLSYYSLAENAINTDSLKRVVSVTNDYKKKIDILNKISDSYINTNSTLFDLYNRQSIALAEQFHYDKGKADAIYLNFKTFKIKDDISNALIFLYKAKAIYYKCKDLNSYADCLVDEGSLFIKKQELKKATLVLFEAKKIYESTGNKGQLALLYSTLGSLNYIQNKTREALLYHEKSLALNIERGFDVGIAVNYVNISNVYKAQKNYLKAYDYVLKALEIKEKLKDKAGIQKCYNNLGVILMNMGEPAKAIAFHLKALDLAIELKKENDIAICYINLGYDYLKALNYTKAIEFTLKGLEIVDKSKDIFMIKEAGRVLSESYAGLGNYAGAYKYQKLYKQYNDSLIKRNYDKELNEIQVRYETSQKDNQINALEIKSASQQVRLQRTRVYVLLFIGLFVIVTIIVVLLYKQSKNNKKIQVKLKEINDIKSAFFANLSHEFRTPLTLMLGPLEKLLDKANNEDKIFLQLIHRNASRLLALDEQLLEFTRIDSGNQRLKLAKGDISSLISAIAESFILHAKTKNIQFNQYYPEERTEAIFDPDIVEKVVGNLVSNAIKYTKRDGKVEITVSFIENEFKVQNKSMSNFKTIRIDVSDNGQGIPVEKQNEIFERFYQLNNYTSGIYDGYGIGLALVKELIHLHKGQILLKSTEGEGSLFTVLLPIETDAYSSYEINNVIALKTFDYKSVEIKTNNQELLSTETLVEDEKFENISIDKLSLLVVDDNPDMRTYLNEILKDDYHISLASDGNEGLLAAINIKPDLVITDVMMLKMDGIEFCQKLKSNSKTNHIPVIMLTALTTLEDKIYGLKNGADEYMEKPFRTKELIARINNLISQRKFLKDLFTKELKLEPKAIAISSSDATFVQKLINIIENNIDNPDLDVEVLASEAALSRSQLHRKITTISGQSASNFIRIIRIKRAAQMIQLKSGNISEIMYSVGFNNLSYFSKSFKEVYQMTPSEYMTIQHETQLT
ncbi:MAG: response regulator [Bacteroidales bacterium]